jgi:hypothetical protein
MREAVRNLAKYYEEYGENKAETISCERILAKAKILRTGIASEAIDAVMGAYEQSVRRRIEKEEKI